MIIIELQCDYIKKIAHVAVKRINKKTGAYETTRYEIPEASPRNKPLALLLQSERCVWSNYSKGILTHNIKDKNEIWPDPNFR